jgi:hypothetical protein
MNLWHKKCFVLFLQKKKTFKGVAILHKKKEKIWKKNVKILL